MNKIGFSGFAFSGKKTLESYLESSWPATSQRSSPSSQTWFVRKITCAFRKEPPCVIDILFIQPPSTSALCLPGFHLSEDSVSIMKDIQNWIFLIDPQEGMLDLSISFVHTFIEDLQKLRESFSVAFVVNKSDLVPEMDEIMAQISSELGIYSPLFVDFICAKNGDGVARVMSTFLQMKIELPALCLTSTRAG